MVPRRINTTAAVLGVICFTILFVCLKASGRAPTQEETTDIAAAFHALARSLLPLISH